MEKLADRLSPVNDTIARLIDRFTEPARYKLKFYHIAVLMFVQYTLGRLSAKIDEQKKNPQKLKEELYSSETFKRAKVMASSSYAQFKNFTANLQSMNAECRTACETPALFCEPYIHTGFRPANKPYTYYIKSLFMKHNETVNAWSHYIGSLYIFSLVFRYELSDPYSWPLLTCILNTSVMFFTSASAHLMHQKSQRTHMTCFLCDYNGISFNVYGCALVANYICSPIWYYQLLQPVFLPLVGFTSMICAILNCLALTIYKRPYPPSKRVLQFAPCTIAWFATNLPIFIQFFSSQSDMVLSYSSHLISYVLFLFGAVCFALDIPQRWCPGKLDFIGQGHHLFHICIFLVSVFQIDALYTDFQVNRDVIANSRAPPSVLFCFGSSALMLAYSLFLIRCFRQMIGHCFDEQGVYIDTEPEVTSNKSD